MQKLIVRNVGPITDAVIELKKVNVFIGPQSSGKSTIAKIISFCTWLEKNKHEMEGSTLFDNNVINRMINYHRMEGYLSEDSVIFYQGDNIAFAYNWPTKEVLPLEFSHYNASHIGEKEILFFNTERLSNPKVLYIPAERNFVAGVPNLQKYDESKDSLQSFILDWFEAKRYFRKDKALNLIDLGMKYYSENDEDYIQIENGKSIKIRNASSGLQSVTPLLVVTDYMTNGMYEKDRPFSVEEQDVLNNTLQNIASGTLTDEKVAEMRRRLLGFIQGKVYTHTQFVIEEPEQNLYPQEQYKLLEYLVSVINHGKQHKMTITTHSPYIINFLNVLLRRKNNSVAHLNNEQLNVFLVSNGIVSNLMMHNKTGEKWAVDTSVLNAAMEDIADEFENLI